MEEIYPVENSLKKVGVLVELNPEEKQARSIHDGEINFFVNRGLRRKNESLVGPASS